MGKLFIAAVVALLLPAQAWAQTLTLNCPYESSYDTKANSETPMSGGFSAIVRMAETIATIEATTFGCFDYVGSFTEQEVAVGCERVAAGVTIKAALTINRINGDFSHTTLIGQSYRMNSGRCTVAKKLF